MKPAYILRFPKVRYSSSNLFSDSDLKAISGLLGNTKEAKLFSLKMEDIAYKSTRVLLSQGEKAEMNYSTSRDRMENILSSAKALSRDLAPLSSRSPSAASTHDWKTNSLISNNMTKPSYLALGDEFSLWTIEQGLHALIDATTIATESIAKRKNLIEHPIHYFSHQSISTYESFFNKAPSIQRESKFVQAIGRIVDIANLLPSNKGYTTYHFLNKAKENRIEGKRINQLGFFND